MSARVSVFSPTFDRPSRLAQASIVRHRPMPCPAPMRRAAFDALMAPIHARTVAQVRQSWCSSCGGAHGIEAHNLQCAANGERSYACRARPGYGGRMVLWDAAHALTTVVEVGA